MLSALVCEREQFHVVITGALEPVGQVVGDDAGLPEIPPQLRGLTDDDDELLNRVIGDGT